MMMADEEDLSFEERESVERIKKAAKVELERDYPILKWSNEFGKAGRKSLYRVIWWMFLVGGSILFIKINPDFFKSFLGFGNSGHK